MRVIQLLYDIYMIIVHRYEPWINPGLHVAKNLLILFLTKYGASTKKTKTTFEKSGNNLIKTQI
jgi:hypothetical protein